MARARWRGTIIIDKAYAAVTHRLIFGVDHEAETVEMHVQVDYAGPAEDFAWVLPVKGEPDVFLSHSSLFQSLPAALPTWFRIDGDDSTCSMFSSSSTT